MEKKKRIYLSLPISGMDIEERRATAQGIEDALSAEWEVVNPLKNGLPITATTNEHMKRDLELLLTCDAVYFMKRFTHSAGCHTEFFVATAIGLDVYFEEVENIVHKGIKFS